MKTTRMKKPLLERMAAKQAALANPNATPFTIMGFKEFLKTQRATGSPDAPAGLTPSNALAAISGKNDEF